MINRIREVRKEKGYTMTTMAKEVGCSVPYMYDVEMGHRKPSASTMAKISDFLDTPVNELYAKEEAK